MRSDPRATVEAALEAIRARGYYAAFEESPSPRVYGDRAAAAGKAAFEALLGVRFEVSTPGSSATVSTERSPYGIGLDVQYPHLTADGLDDLMAAASAGIADWRDAGPDRRLDVCLSILNGLYDRIFELANAVMATTGQAFVMAFQAGGAHALDRGLEATALAYDQMRRWPSNSLWEKPVKRGTLRMTSSFTVVPRGIAVVIASTTFPTWNSYPGLFASLVTGNPVVVKPHPGAVLPLAITVQECQRQLAEHGFDPHLVTLAAEHPEDELAKDLVTRPEVRLVDFTGGNEFGTWVEQNAGNATVFAEKSGVNSVVIDSTDSFRGMCKNLAFTLALYSGQMCTTTQAIFIPDHGVQTDEGHKSYEEVCAAIAGAVDDLLNEDDKAVNILGAIVNDGVLARLALAPQYGSTVLPSREITHPDYPEAVVRTPALVSLEAEGVDAYGRECFGPVAFLIRTRDTAESLELVADVTSSVGAMTFGVYSTSDRVLASAADVALDAGVPLSQNLTDGVYLNQTMAYVDLHGSGANPAASAAFTDVSFVASRFRIVQVRKHPAS